MLRLCQNHLPRLRPRCRELEANDVAGRRISLVRSNKREAHDDSPELVARLIEEARQRGLSLDVCLLQAVLERRAENGAPISDETERRRSREEAGRSIRELRKGNILGPDLSIRDLIDERRRF